MSDPKDPPGFRRIAHLDMDAFYASVELLRYPQLQGWPVVIGGARRRADDRLLMQHAGVALQDIPVEDFPRLRDYVGRGVITTANYVARQFGMGSAMGLMKAAAHCPDAILLPVDFDEYRRYSRLFKAEILALTPHMEDRGIDEVYIDLSDLAGCHADGGREWAARLQNNIFTATGLTCSVGVAPNKLIAKMASELQKPNGLSILDESDLETRIWPLPCRKINGIGPKMSEKLARCGVHSIGDLAAQNPIWLMQNFGKSHGLWLHAAAHGRDDRPVQTNSEAISISRETTFDRDLHPVQDKAILTRIFTRLCEQVADDLQRKGYVGKTIGVKIRYDNFKSATRDHTGEHYTADGATIRAMARRCLRRIPLDRRLRLLGVRVASLKRLEQVEQDDAAMRRQAQDGWTLPLFDEVSGLGFHAGPFIS